MNMSINHDDYESQSIREQQIKVILKVSQDRVTELNGTLESIIHSIDEMIEEDL